jgi:hypothetical protein
MIRKICIAGLKIQMSDRDPGQIPASGLVHNPYGTTGVGTRVPHFFAALACHQSTQQHSFISSKEKKN